MKKITDGRYDDLLATHPRKTMISAELQNMGVGEVLKIDREEWTLVTSPVNSIGSACAHPRSKLYRKKFMIRTLLDKSGWVIKRLK